MPWYLAVFKGPILALFGIVLNIAAARGKAEIAKLKVDQASKDSLNQAVDGFLVETITAAAEKTK